MDTSRQLHVLLVHVWYWPHVGGGDQHVEQIGRELVRRGHRVTVWCADVPAHEERRFTRGGVEVIRIGPSRVLGGVAPVVSVRVSKDLRNISAGALARVSDLGGTLARP